MGCEALSDDDGEYFSECYSRVKRAIHARSEGLLPWTGSGVWQVELRWSISGRKLDAHWLSMQLHIGYLCSLEDSERVREACLNYLRSSQIHFYPDKLDIIKQADELAKELGGQLGTPCLSWKYAWIKSIFGWRLAKSAQQELLRFRWSFSRSWDLGLFRMGKRMNKLALATSQALKKPQGQYQRITATHFPGGHL